MPKWNPVITIKVWKNINNDHDVWKHVKKFVTGLITDRTDHLFFVLGVCVGLCMADTVLKWPCNALITVCLDL